MNPLRSHLLPLMSLFATFVLAPISAPAAVSAGSLSIVGYDDGEDSFTVIVLSPIAAGEVVYFTNNGWNTSLGQFNGASPDQGAGNESLIKLTATSTIAKGTIFNTTFSGVSWSWTKTGRIPGQSEYGLSEFSDLALDFESDQIYIFQAAGLNPLQSPTHFIYALHSGTADYPTFSDAEDTLTGNLPPGLSVLAKTAFAHTNFGFHGDADGNHSAWGINMSAPAISALQSGGGHKEDWLAAIANSSNWGSGQPGVTSFFVMPEPGRPLLLGVGALGMLLRRRRQSRNIQHK